MIIDQSTQRTAGRGDRHEATDAPIQPSDRGYPRTVGIHPPTTP